MITTCGHHAARDRLASWLRNLADVGHANGWAQWGDVFSWPVTHKANHRGIWTEYPFQPYGIGAEPTWDALDPRYADAPPTYREMTKRHQPVQCIVDVAVTGRDRVYAALEVVRGHPIDQNKINFLLASGISKIFEFDWQWIMNQPVGVIPPEIPPEFFRFGIATPIPIYDRQISLERSNRALLRIISA
jgi:hypothetical protein